MTNLYAKLEYNYTVKYYEYKYHQYNDEISEEGVPHYSSDLHLPDELRNVSVHVTDPYTSLEVVVAGYTTRTGLSRLIETRIEHFDNETYYEQDYRWLGYYITSEITFVEFVESDTSPTPEQEIPVMVLAGYSYYWDSYRNQGTVPTPPSLPDVEYMSYFKFQYYYMGVVPESLDDDILFDGSANVVNFGGLFPDQISAIAEGASLYFAGGGSDTVLLPDLGDAEASGFVIGTAFYGETGDDTIRGGTGNDVIDGGADNDTLYLSKGIDSLLGGTGDDTFVLDAAAGALGTSDKAQIDGGANSQNGKDVLRLIGAATDYNIQVMANGGTKFTEKTHKYVVETTGVELVQFGEAVKNKVALAGTKNGIDGTYAGESAEQMWEVYSWRSAVGERRGWHDLSAIELGMAPSGSGPAEAGGNYTFSGGLFHFEGPGAFGLPNTSNVTVTVGVDADGTRTLMVAFQGSDAPWEDPQDWAYDVGGVDPFYKRHADLVKGIIDYIKEADNGIDKVVVTGHSLGGAMTQELLYDLQEQTHGVDLKGYTFGSIGVLSADISQSNLINFLHTGDIANLSNNIVETRKGSTVYLQSEIGLFDYALPAAVLSSILRGNPLTGVALAAFANSVRLHSVDLYRADATNLIAEAQNIDSLFHGSALAKSLRDGVAYAGEAGGTIAGGSVIQVFAGGAEANEYEIAKGDDYVLGGGGNDSFTLSSPTASDKRHIDGGTGTDRLVVYGDFDDFLLVQLNSGISLRRASGEEVATIDHIEQIVYRDIVDRVFGSETVQYLGAPNGAPRQDRAAAAAPPKSYALKTGYDYAVAGDGAMIIKGTASADILYVGRGNKTIAMGDGNDIVIVKAAAGTGALKEKISIDGGKGADIMQGGRGAETFIVDDARDIVHDDGGKDVVKASVDYQLGDGIEALILTGNARNGFGNTGANAITGTGKANTLDGLGGNDTLSGGKGADTLVGGLGTDSLTGGGQADTFTFNAKVSSKNVDVITDFKHDLDLIALDDAIFSQIGPKLDKAEFYAAAGATKAHDRSDRIIYDTKSGKLFYDDDGSKKHGHDAIHFATLTHKPALDFEDFVIA